MEYLQKSEVFAYFSLAAALYDRLGLTDWKNKSRILYWHDIITTTEAEAFVERINSFIDYDRSGFEEE